MKVTFPPGVPLDEVTVDDSVTQWRTLAFFGFAEPWVFVACLAGGGVVPPVMVSVSEPFDARLFGSPEYAAAIVYLPAASVVLHVAMLAPPPS